MTVPPPPSIRATLRHSWRFRRLLAALAVSQAGDWLYNLALIAFVYSSTRSATWVALTTAARVLPIVVLGPVGGVLADRWSRRVTMIVSDLVRAVLMVGLAVLAAAGGPVVLAPVLAALATVAAVVYPPCAAASTARLVEAADLPGANAARAVVGQASIVAGPAAGGLLLLLGPPEVSFLVNAVTFTLSALLVASIPAGEHFRPAGTGGASATLLAGIRSGAAALRAHPAVLRVLGADVVCSACAGVLSVLLVVLAGRLGHGVSGFGYLLAGVGVGGVLATPLAGRAAAGRPARASAIALLVVAVALPAFLLAPNLAVAVVLCAVIGGGSVLVEVLTETTLQSALDDAVFARAYGIALPASLGGIIVGALAAPALLDAFGLAGALGVLAAGVAGYAGLLLAPRRAAHAAEPAPAR